MEMGKERWKQNRCYNADSQRGAITVPLPVYDPEAVENESVKVSHR